MQENMTQKNSEYGHFSRSIDCPLYVAPQPCIRKDVNIGQYILVNIIETLNIMVPPL